MQSSQTVFISWYLQSSVSSPEKTIREEPCPPLIKKIAELIKKYVFSLLIVVNVV